MFMAYTYAPDWRSKSFEKLNDAKSWLMEVAKNGQYCEIVSNNRIVCSTNDAPSNIWHHI